MKIAGEAVYVDAAGKRHSIEGLGSLPDNDELRSLDAAGEFSFGGISCDEMKVSGSCSGKSVAAKNISAEGSFEVDAVKVEEKFKLSGSAEIDSLHAKEILIESRGGSIGAIKCGKLKIFHNEIHEVGSSILSRIFNHKVSQHSDSRVRIETIDAETVHLENCEVNVIRCKDVFIGKNCAVEKLFVAGECTVADDSTVGETIRT